MEQLELFPLPNPCIGVCQANNKGYCHGCLRSRKERQKWYAMNNTEKHHVLQRCGLRRQKLQQLAKQQGVAEVLLPEQLDFDF